MEKETKFITPFAWQRDWKIGDMVECIDLRQFPYPVRGKVVVVLPDPLDYTELAIELDSPALRPPVVYVSERSCKLIQGEK